MLLLNSWWKYRKVPLRGHLRRLRPNCSSLASYVHSFAADTLQFLLNFTSAVTGVVLFVAESTGRLSFLSFVAVSTEVRPCAFDASRRHITVSIWCPNPWHLLHWTISLFLCTMYRGEVYNVLLRFFFGVSTSWSLAPTLSYSKPF